MTDELKTLKDLTNNNRDSFDCNASLIKAEAVKWVEDLEENRNVNGKNWTNGAVFIIKLMNNITEEDLQ